MSNRVSIDDVSAILPSGVAEATIQAGIDSANLLVEENLVGKPLTDLRMRLVEMYLAGHFVTLIIGEKSSEKIGDATNVYVKHTGRGLAETALGRTALTFDTTGTLASLAEGVSDFEMVT